MTEKPNFAELASICQQAFEDRRKYEWKLNFSFWGALGLIAYWAHKEGFQPFPHGSHAYWIIPTLLMGAYILAFILFFAANAKDKKWKHYYMKREEEYTVGCDCKQGEPDPIPIVGMILWGLHHVVFTGILVILAVRVLISVEAKPKQEETNISGKAVQVDHVLRDANR